MKAANSGGGVLPTAIAASPLSRSSAAGSRTALRRGGGEA